MSPEGDESIYFVSPLVCLTFVHLSQNSFIVVTNNRASHVLSFEQNRVSQPENREGHFGLSFVLKL